MTTKTTRIPRVSIKTRDLMKRFEDATVALSWLGSRAVSEHAEIKEEYRAARSAFIAHLLDLENRAESWSGSAGSVGDGQCGGRETVAQPPDQQCPARGRRVMRKPLP